MKGLPVKLLFVALTGITACQKELTTTKLQQDIAGTWELSKSYVGINVNGGIINYQPGNGNTITFGAGGLITQTVVNADTTYTTTGTYSLQKEDKCGINLLTKENNSNDSFEYNIAVHQDSLIMSAGSCIMDAGSSIYLRIH